MYSMVLVAYKSEKHFHLCAASSIPFVLTLKAANRGTVIKESVITNVFADQQSNCSLKNQAYSDIFFPVLA
jgi:hypothetical protein